MDAGAWAGWVAIPIAVLGVLIGVAAYRRTSPYRGEWSVERTTDMMYRLLNRGPERALRVRVKTTNLRDVANLHERAVVEVGGSIEFSAITSGPRELPDLLPSLTIRWKRPRRWFTIRRDDDEVWSTELDPRWKV